MAGRAIITRMEHVHGPSDMANDHPPAHSGHDAHASSAGHASHVAPAHQGTAALAHAGHHRHGGHSVAMFRNRFWISLLLTIPTLVWGEMIPRALGFTPPDVPAARWIPAIFGTAVFLVGGLVFLQGAWRELADRTPGMMTLISLAISVAFLFSVAMPLWWEVASLVTIMLLGHWMEMRAITRAQGALHALSKLLPSVATRMENGRAVDVTIAHLRIGDLVLVRPGGSVPADGIVRDGGSTVDESMLTGESRRVEKRLGSEVTAGTVNGEGSLHVQVTRIGDATALARIVRLVADAQQSRSRAQVLADRAAFVLTIVAIASALATAIVWSMRGASLQFT